MRARSQTPSHPCPPPPTPANSLGNPGQGPHCCPAQALPESEFPHIPDQPEYGVPQALCSLKSLNPGIGVGPARGCQGELSDSGAGGRLRGRSETCTEEAGGLGGPWGQDTDSLDSDVQGFFFMGSESPAKPSLLMEAGRRGASEKL